MTRNILLVYYAATAVFVSLDYGFDINVRAAFLESEPTLRFAFYLVLFACFVLMIWRPQWATLIGTIESLATLIALILSMALRSMVVTDAMLETGTGLVTMPEIINFIIVGGAAYVSYFQGIKRLTRRSGSD
jgi:glucan phosphoethanolaminetransferase (alkaline phosphatase superfamily)